LKTRNHTSLPPRLLLFLAMALAADTARAQAYCRADNTPSYQIDVDAHARSNNTIELSADSARSSAADVNVIELVGGISIRHQDGELAAESASYNTITGVATVDGDLSFVTRGLRVSGAKASVAVDQGTFALGQSGYEFNAGGVRSHGQASAINRDQDGSLTLENASYSSCPPGDNGWRLSTSSLKLDQEEGVGTARDVSLRFKGVPIFYTPVFSFPIDDRRKTGFLLPRFDQTDQTGLEYRQPFYWNIAPNWDATFLGRSMTDRGFQLQTEVRHLNHLGAWTLNQEYIGNDDRFEAGKSRQFARLRQNGVFGDHWSSEIDVGSVSDREYFEDLGDTLKVASITHLQRRADLNYRSPRYDFRARMLSYQTVDSNIAEDQRPYRLLPQLRLRYRHPGKLRGLEASLDSELVFFDRDNSVTGSRLDLAPRLEWNVTRRGWFSTLASTWRFTRYDLNNTGAAFDSTSTRNIPILSADAGLFLDRELASGSTISLEPRAFYLYARRRDQSRLPLFDTGALDFNFAQLFRENRFSGADRINDANQLSLALSSRLIDGKSRRERMQGSIGQIFYFDDRTVTLDGSDSATDSVSDLVAELSGQIDRHWSAASNLQWNPNTRDTKRSAVQLSYRLADDKLFNFGHRFLEGSGEFLNSSIYWPLGEQWKFAAGWNYSLDENTNIENVLGLEYESCCWAFRLAARQFITDDGEDTNTSYFFQLVLKGLAPVGQNVSEVLSEGIGGYRNNLR
jgi:LPS-assembly protein